MNRRSISMKTSFKNFFWFQTLLIFYLLSSLPRKKPSRENTEKVDLSSLKIDYTREVFIYKDIVLFTCDN
jgi:hypothetical protein